MPRSIRVSVPRRLLHTDDPIRQAYLTAIADCGLSIELFTPSRHQPDNPLSGFIHEELNNEPAVQLANEFGLSVDSVHMTPLMGGCSNNGARICADKIKDAMLGYVDAESADDVKRYQYCDPDTVVFHPPRFRADDTVKQIIRRQQLIGTLGNATHQLKKQDEIRNVPEITIENVCPRGSFRYLLTEPADINRFETARDRLQAGQDGEVTVPPVAYTLDIGHAGNPLAMLNAIGTPTHVHLHGTTSNTDAARHQLRDTYDINTNESVGTVEPGNSLQHLPPVAGDESLQPIIDKLTEVGYTGPIVLELVPPYLTAEILLNSVEAIRDAGW